MSRRNKFFGIGALVILETGVKGVVARKRAATELDLALPALEIATPFGLRSPDCHHLSPSTYRAQRGAMDRHKLVLRFKRGGCGDVPPLGHKILS
jgi:hypothetical protein